jgi:phytol kinase
MMNPWLAILLVLGTLAVMLGAVRLHQKTAHPHPELARKLLHVGMGLVAVSFPWLFDRSWPVLVLGVLSFGLMVALRTVKILRGSVGCVVNDVNRASFGDLYFPISVLVLFHLYLWSPEVSATLRLMLYCIPLLLLTLADAAAALVGVHYGYLRYSTSEGVKSTEGSLAFFLCAFFCVHVPLLLATDIGRPQTLLIALLLAWLATLFEAVAWAGLDNLVLPLVAYLLLRTYLGLSVEELTARLVVTGCLLTFVLLYRRRTTLVGSALLGACLVGYLSWSVGGWRWLLAPLIVFLGYKLLTPALPNEERRDHNVHAVVCVSAAGLLWLCLSGLLGRPELLFLFTLTFACQMAIIVVVRLGARYQQLSCHVLLLLGILQGWLLLFVPYILIERSSSCLLCTVAALPGVALAAAGFYYTQPLVRACPTNTARWLRQAYYGGLGSTLGLVPLYWIGLSA